MLDCAVLPSNDFFRFSTTDQKWEQLDATRVSGSPPSARIDHTMVSVGSDFYVFGGKTTSFVWRGNILTITGEEGLCDDGHRLGACQIERLGDAPRAAAALVSSGVQCSAAPGSGDARWHITAILAPWVKTGAPMSMFISRGRWCSGGPCRGWYRHVT